MKAFILAAGFGTRLLPYTKTIPKPLFTINSIPIIQHTIKKLINTGCSEILINTHHLHNQIENFIEKNNFPVKVTTIFEPEILGTGGAVKNIQSEFSKSTFIIINSDILFSIDLKKIIQIHFAGNNLASLVLHKHDKFNKIEIDENNFIKSFDTLHDPYAFTGIQILSPKIFDLMPDKKKFSIIDFYKDQLKRNQKIKAIVLKDNYFWEDIGTIDTYKLISMKYLTSAIKKTNKNNINQIQVEKLLGDGSDREWFRIKTPDKSYIAADHGINIADKSNTTVQLDSFINIGIHLHGKGLPVPEIHNFDTFSGIAIVEDLGDTHLEQIVNSTTDNNRVLSLYKKVCDSLIAFSSTGFQNFDNKWTFETKEYSKKVILEQECRYFIDAFVNSYLKKNKKFLSFLKEFEIIADNCIDSSCKGLMHRDMQSKNIMVKDDSIFFIDFQSARKGPLEYDIASLLIDPYVELNNIQKKIILAYLIDKLSRNKNFDAKRFKHCYKYCCVARNLQILGAFSFLSKIKKKKKFEKYIPYALNTLKEHINLINIEKIPKLTNFINKLRV